MKLKKFLDLKVYKNKKTGQASVLLPKRKLKKIPKSVRLEVKW